MRLRPKNNELIIKIVINKSYRVNYNFCINLI